MEKNHHFLSLINGKIRHFFIFYFEEAKGTFAAKGQASELLLKL